MHCICGYWSCSQTYNISFSFFEILQGIGQYIPHKVEELLVYAHSCCLFMHTQSLQELWEDTREESESDAHVMAQTPLKGSTQASQLIINSIFFLSYWLLLRWGWSKTSQRRHCLALRSSLVSRGTPRSHIPTTEVSCLKREIFHGRVWFECLGVVFLNEWTVLLPIVSTSPHPHINCGKSFSFGLVLFQ